MAGWKKAHDNFEALKGVETKTVEMPGGFEVKVQYNPARMVSTGAKMDAATLKKRPCFLCDQNRPAEQGDLDWGRYHVLVNPFPIFPRHLTIPVKEHGPQIILGRAGDMAQLALELPEYVVFYNGQKCGASAPDHMHFQAGNRDFLPLIEQLGEIEWVADGIGYPKSAAVLPGVIVIDAASPAQAAARFDKVVKALPVDKQVEDIEPMMNVLCYACGEGVRMLVIPRKQHRPDFYGDGPGQMILSPASVDLGGVMITPRKEDFEAVDAQIIAEAFRQLCYNHEEIIDLCKRMK